MSRFPVTRNFPRIKRTVSITLKVNLDVDYFRSMIAESKHEDIAALANSETALPTLISIFNEAIEISSTREV